MFGVQRVQRLQLHQWLKMNHSAAATWGWMTCVYASSRRVTGKYLAVNFDLPPSQTSAHVGATVHTKLWHQRLGKKLKRQIFLKPHWVTFHTRETALVSILLILKHPFSEIGSRFLMIHANRKSSHLIICPSVWVMQSLYSFLFITCWKAQHADAGWINRSDEK